MKEKYIEDAIDPQGDGCPEPAFRAGERTFGFHIQRVEKIPDMRMTAYEIQHEASAAKVLILHCPDRENLYSIGFRTPPKDSTGVAHILEHAVLAGSEKYPVKDAFNELARGTLQTFINAFTYPDKTLYPVASQVPKDYFNLARVYTDLVLRPCLRRETFRQEGHHLEFEKPDDDRSPLNVTGIVFNEMKGAYSSPDALMWKAIQEALYPDTLYAFDSGGNPEVIPFLTYEQLREFHRTFYSPSNARFLIYGDISPEDHLAFLKEMLQGFGLTAVDSGIESQPRWKEPSRTHGFFPIGKKEDTAGKTTVNLAWMMADNRDPETVILLKIVARALLGTAAGPLRKALIDSGLGEDLSPASGLESDLRQIAFVAGLRGTEPERAEKIETLIMKTLEDIAASGIERDIIEGAFHQMEFGLKEIVRKRYPFGIVLMSRIYRTWLYDGDPLLGLRFSGILDGIRGKWTADERLFQDTVKKWFVDNPHRVLSVMEPSRTFLEERDEIFRNMMSQAEEGLSAADREDIRRESSALRIYQEESDSAEARASLPALKIGDVPRRLEKLPTERSVLSGIPVLKHGIFTNGIAYLHLAFDASCVPDDLQPYMSLLGKVTTGMGAAGLGYEDMARRIALKTGGIDFRLQAGRSADGRTCWQKFVITVRALKRNVPEAVGILEDLLCDGDLGDASRMLDLFQEKKNSLLSSVVPSGHLFAGRTAASSLFLNALREEQWYGRTQLATLGHVTNHFQEEKHRIREKLGRLRDMVFTRTGLQVSMTADESGLAGLSDRVSGLILRMPAGREGGEAAEPEPRPSRTGVIVPAQVCYVAQVFPAPAYVSPQAPPLMVLSRLLSSGYLYRRIRVQGGAYGGMSVYEPLGGYLSFLSYRDPRLAETLGVYEQALGHLLKESFTQEELEKAVIGTIGALDRPMDPEMKGSAAMTRAFAGLTDEDRQVFRDGVFRADVRSIREAAEACLSDSRRRSSVCAYASEGDLEKVNESMSDGLSILPLL